MRVAPDIFWEEGACRSTNPEQVGRTSQSSRKGFIETSGECFSFGKTEHGGHIQGSRKMRVIPEIFWEEEMPQSRRLNFITIKFGASKASIDDDYLYSLYKSLIVAYTKSGVIPNFSKSSFVPSPLRTNTEFIPAFFPQAMSV